MTITRVDTYTKSYTRELEINEALAQRIEKWLKEHCEVDVYMNLPDITPELIEDMWNGTEDYWYDVVIEYDNTSLQFGLLMSQLITNIMGAMSPIEEDADENWLDTEYETW